MGIRERVDTMTMNNSKVSGIVVSVPKGTEGSRAEYAGAGGIAGYYVRVAGRELSHEDWMAVCNTDSRFNEMRLARAIVTDDGRVLLGRAGWQQAGPVVDVTNIAILLKCRI